MLLDWERVACHSTASSVLRRQRLQSSTWHYHYFFIACDYHYLHCSYNCSYSTVIHVTILTVFIVILAVLSLVLIPI